MLERASRNAAQKSSSSHPPRFAPRALPLWLEFPLDYKTGSVQSKALDVLDQTICEPPLNGEKTDVPVMVNLESALVLSLDEIDQFADAGAIHRPKPVLQIAIPPKNRKKDKKDKTIPGQHSPGSEQHDKFFPPMVTDNDPPKELLNNKRKRTITVAAIDLDQE